MMAKRRMLLENRDMEVYKVEGDFENTCYPVRVERWVSRHNHKDIYRVKLAYSGRSIYVSSEKLLFPSPTQHSLTSRMAQPGDLVDVYINGGFWPARVNAFVAPPDRKAPFYQIMLLATGRFMDVFPVEIRPHVQLGYRRLLKQELELYVPGGNQSYSVIADEFISRRDLSSGEEDSFRVTFIHSRRTIIVPASRLLFPPPSRQYSLTARRGQLVEVYKEGCFWTARVRSIVRTHDRTAPYYQIRVRATGMVMDVFPTQLRPHIAYTPRLSQMRTFLRRNNLQ